MQQVVKAVYKGIMFISLFNSRKYSDGQPVSCFVDHLNWWQITKWLIIALLHSMCGGGEVGEGKGFISNHRLLFEFFLLCLNL